jgi:hypothetical protein
VLNNSPIALASRAGVLIDTGRFSQKKGSICLVANAQIEGCKSQKEGRGFRYSAQGTLAALKLGIDYTLDKTNLCWLVLAWYGTFENGNRELRDKLWLDVKNGK